MKVCHLKRHLQLLQHSHHHHSHKLFHRCFSRDATLASRGVVEMGSINNEPVELAHIVTHAPSFHKWPNHANSLLLLHGVLGSSRNWKSVSSELSKQVNINCIALDARNHGESPHDNVMTIDSQVLDLKHFVDTNRLNKTFLLGHSMGGRVVMQFACQYPSIVEKLIVVDISPVVHSTYKEIQELILLLKEIDLSKNVSRSHVERELQKKIKDPITTGFLLQNLVQNQPHHHHHSHPHNHQHHYHQEMHYQYRWRIPLDTIYHALPAMTTQMMVEGQQYLGPTLFVGGKKSKFIQPDHYPTINKYFPKAVVHMIEDSGHVPHFEKPVEFLNVVKNFLLQ